MKGKNIKRSWKLDFTLPDGTFWSYSDSGWTNDEIGLEVAKHLELIRNLELNTRDRK